MVDPDVTDFTRHSRAGMELPPEDQSSAHPRAQGDQEKILVDGPGAVAGFSEGRQGGVVAHLDGGAKNFSDPACKGFPCQKGEIGRTRHRVSGRLNDSRNPEADSFFGDFFADFPGRRGDGLQAGFLVLRGRDG